MIKSGRDFQGNPRSQLEVSVAWQLRENLKAIFTVNPMQKPERI